jgi:diguanylate cyclase (GGDEF)-like protein/PAS domain S-box-containing protein
MRHALVILLALLASLAASPSGAQPREVRVGIYANPPKIMLASNGQPTGILGDLLSEIARRENWVLQPIACEWDACLEALREGRIDLLPDLAYTEARAREYDFHGTPALHSWSQLYRRSDVVIDSMLDMDGRRIALLGGSVQQEYLTRLAEGFGLNVEWHVMASMEATVAEVVAGRADAVATNHHFGDWSAQREGLLQTGVIFLPSRLHYATTRYRNADLLQAIDRHLSRWRANSDSHYYQVLRHWSAPAPDAGLPGYVRWVAVGLAGLMVLALLLVALLRREVGRQTRSLRASEERLATILNSVDAHIYIKGPDLRYRYVNSKMSELFQRDAADITGCGDDVLFDADTTAALASNDRKVLDSGERLVVEEFTRGLEHGWQRTFLSVKLPLRDADGRITSLCGISTDITEQHLLLAQLHELANFDPLTRLPNRQQLLQRLGEALDACARHAQQGALLVLNLDRFQALNDTRGHAAGDQWLQRVAERIRPCLREGQLAARLGADEFGFVIPHLPLSGHEAQRQVATFAQSILDVAGGADELAGQTYRGAGSIGVSLFADDSATAEDVLRRADLALSEAKLAGGNRVRFFQPEMQTALAARASLEDDLRAGLEAGQFLLHFQPQVEQQGRPIGVEALIRWRHPQRGLVPPASFIPLAEACGLIEPIGRWVLDEACRQLGAWQTDAATRHLRMSVNVSARQLHLAGFVDEVLGILHSHAAPPAQLELEITESLLVEDIDEAVGKLQALRRHGIRIALDDFGTGYSTLNYIKRLPLDMLKIDTSFVRDLLLDANDLAIVRTIIGLGVSLGLEVLAEGVEDQGQHQVLEDLGCRLFQGFHYSRPLPVDALSDWLHARPASTSLDRVSES